MGGEVRDEGTRSPSEAVRALDNLLWSWLHAPVNALTSMHILSESSVCLNKRYFKGLFTI
jgi:hypothetical protein